uniref:Uncharacterized protein n=1 Tax=Heterorhabditis bacteriophora TaxID=37862 RepID=A0A1I7WL33_HETBA
MRCWYYKSANSAALSNCTHNT